MTAAPTVPFPIGLMDDPDIPEETRRSAIAVYLALGRTQQENGEARFNDRQLAQAARMGRNTGLRAVTALESAGWIERHTQMDGNKWLPSLFVVHEKKHGTRGEPQYRSVA